MYKDFQSPWSWSFVLIPFLAVLALFISIFNFDTTLAPISLSLKSKVVMPDVEKLDLFLNGVPGVAIATFEDGETNILTRGKSRSILGSDITGNSVFEAASLSKPLTALATLQLVSEGHLDLDSVIYGNNIGFTIRQLLTHTAGFDNQLGSEMMPTSESGKFSYSGQGYMKLAQLIEAKTNMSFKDYMNQHILPLIGMDQSYFGDISDRSNEVYPHVSIVMPEMAGVLMVLLFTAFLSVLTWMIQWVRKKDINRYHQKLILVVSVFVSVALPFLVVGINNGIRFALVNIFTFLIIILVYRGYLAITESTTGNTIMYRSLGTIGLILIVSLLYFRPPIPLKYRKSNFLPAAGLKTTAADYSKFLMEIVNPTKFDADLVQEMIKPQIEVNEHNSWGLGVGLQKGKELSVWHWGVNYPGFQSLFIAWPSRKSGVVVLMNGGPMSLGSGSPRFQGLEFARMLIAKTFGGEHYSYWHNLN